MNSKMIKRAIAMAMVTFMIIGILPFNDNVKPIIADAAETSTITTVDLAQGLTTGTSYAGQGNMSVLGNLTYSTETQAIAGVTYEGFVTSGTNPTVGADKIPTAGAALKCEPTHDGEVTIAFRILANKVYYVVDESGAEVESISNGTGSAVYYEKTYNVKEGKTYYFYVSGSRIAVYRFSYDAIRITDVIDLTGGLTKDENTKGVIALDNLAYEADTQTIDGATYAGYVTSSNAPTISNGIPSNGASLKFMPTEDGHLELAFKINAGKTYKFYDGDGNELDSVTNSGTGDAFYYRSYSIKGGKTYYAYAVSSTNISIYGITIIRGKDLAKTNWSTVATPTIDSVTTDSQGNFVVNFTANIDSIKGAEWVQITMLEGGFEVSTTKVKEQKSSVTMVPPRSGNYTFIVTAQREGEADKASTPYQVSGYVFALPKPVIESMQNLGNGTVYIDWINVKDAASFRVEYKLASAPSYTVAAESITDDNYTIEGLVQGSTYDIKVSATRAEDGFVSSDIKQVTARATKEQKWYTAIVGSAQEVNATITEEDGTVTSSNLTTKNADSTKKNVEEVPSIANTTGKIEFAGSNYGMISDDEDGLMYYYTVIDPNTENFELTAKFKITSTALNPDNQTGFGIIAMDMLGINYYGEPDYKHKYINSISNLFYSSTGKFMGLRAITGYDNVDTSNAEGATRTATTSKYSTTGAFTVGNEYTIALRKTNDAFEAEYNGQKLTYSDTSILSVQEDGSICVGVMVSKKVSVEISNMTFSTSPSAGVTGAGPVDISITPSTTVYSTSTCGSNTYEYILHTNAAGNLVVTSPTGAELLNRTVAADEVIRVNVPLTVGSNSIISVLTPSAGPNIKSTTPITKTTNVTFQQYGKEGETIIVSQTGTSSGKGTEASPLDIYTAVKYAQPGQTIYVKNGTYTSSVAIARSVCGTPAKNITMVAETVGSVIFKNTFSVNGNYWRIYGINVVDATGVGIKVGGNYNTIEMCTIQGSSNSGLEISRNGSADNNMGISELLWPSYNLIKNCESFDNCDSARNDADGFAAKSTCGVGNKFYGCISHNNISDGWDLNVKKVTGEVGSVTIENCVAYSNGWLTTDNTSVVGYSYGEGNGFRLGGSDMKAAHVLKNCISYNNGEKGITSNSCPDVQVINCTSFNNSVKPSESLTNVDLYTRTSNIKAWVVTGLISMATDNLIKLEDSIPFALHNADNYIYNGKASYNNQGLAATTDWFVNVDVSVAPTRNANGTIDMHGLLQLKAEAPANSGARLDITSASAISIKPVITTEEATTQEATTTEEVTTTQEATTTQGATTQAATTTQATTTTQAPTTTQVATTTQISTEETTEGQTQAPTITPVIVKKVDAVEVAVDQDVVVKNSEGTIVDFSSITLKVYSVDSTGAQAQQKVAEAQQKIDEAIIKNNIAIAVGSEIKYYNICFVDENGNELKVTSGKLKLTFDYPEGIDKDSYDFKIYHILSDGTVETLIPTLTNAGLVVEVTSLSPFAMVYSEKPNIADTDTNTGDSAPIILLLILVVISGGVVALTFDKKKKVT